MPFKLEESKILSLLIEVQSLIVTGIVNPVANAVGPTLPNLVQQHAGAKPGLDLSHSYWGRSQADVQIFYAE